MPQSTYSAEYPIVHAVEHIDLDYTIQSDGVVRVEQLISLKQSNHEGALQLYIPKPYKPAYGRVEVFDISVFTADGKRLVEPDVRVANTINRVTIQIKHPIQDMQFRLVYSMQRVVNIYHFSSNGIDQFQWNAVPGNVQASIETIDVTVHLPHVFAEEDVEQFIISGGAENYLTSSSMQNGTVQFYGIDFPSENGFVIVAEWPAGAVNHLPPVLVARIWRYLQYPYYALPIMVFIFLTIWYVRFGRDPSKKKKILPKQVPPDGLTPAHLGALMEEKVRLQSLIAMIFNLAHRGYIQIVEHKSRTLFTRSEYTFVKAKNIDSDQDLYPVERYFLEALFGQRKMSAYSPVTVRLHTLKNQFARQIHVMRSMIMDDLFEMNYFRETPHTFRFRLAVLTAIFTIIALPIWMITSIVFDDILRGIPALLIPVMIASFAPFMPQRTPKGVQAYTWATGFQQFIENPKQFSHPLPTFPTDLYEELLPYAIVFDLEMEWSQSFEPAVTQRPKWYSNADVAASFSAKDFVLSMQSSFVHAASQILRPSDE